MEQKLRDLIEKWRHEAASIRSFYDNHVPLHREAAALVAEQSADELEALLKANS